MISVFLSAYRGKLTRETRETFKLERMLHFQGLKTHTDHDFRAHSTQTSQNISWASFLLKLVQPPCLFSDYNKWSLDLFWNFSQLIISTSTILTSLLLPDFLMLKALCTQGISSAQNTVLSVLLHLNSVIQVFLLVLAFPIKSIPPHCWKVLSNSIPLREEWLVNV